MLQFALGLLLANLLEWIVHKYFLHNLGKKRASLFSFHWGVHHREARKNGFLDHRVSTREVVVFLLWPTLACLSMLLFIWLFTTIHIEIPIGVTNICGGITTTIWAKTKIEIGA
jgi:hypothetical protein